VNRIIRGWAGTGGFPIALLPPVRQYRGSASQGRLQPYEYAINTFSSCTTIQTPSFRAQSPALPFCRRSIRWIFIPRHGRNQIFISRLIAAIVETYRVVMSKSPSDADDGEGGWGVPALSANGVPTNNKRGRDDLEGNAPMVDGGADELGSHTSTQVLCRFLTCCVSVIGQTQIQGSHSGPSKRKRYVPSSSTARYQLFNRVTCGGGGFHVNHNTFADYLDSPKLFAGDSKGNVLRGKERVVVKDYLEDRPEIAFTVYRLHNCNSYHDEIEDDFDRLPMLPIDPNIISQHKAYFFYLRVE
jgi:hypothetical protein